MKLPTTAHPYLVFWLLLNLVQAHFTELIHDEAYYWFFAQDLDWGYFDHPPAIAIPIWLGGLFFKFELGVRLFIVLMSTATLWLIWKTIDGDDPRLFFVLAFSTVIIHIGGFIAVPDIPLVFFAALFFYFFKQYLEKDSWWMALWIALAVTGMAYSKYQGVLVVLFAMLPNLKLLRRPSLWLIPVLVMALYVPHILWQSEHEFQTFRYQFIDRSNVPYKFEFFINYILGQILIFGPFISFLLFPAAVKFKAVTDFERTMKWCFYGFFGFFLLQSIKMRIEPNWTVITAVTVFYMGYYFIKNREKQERWAYKLLVPSLALIFLFRVFMMYNFLPGGWLKRNEFHDWDTWAERIAEKAGDLPVVFHNTFQKPSKYMFYARKFAHATNYVDYAGKEYDLKIKTEEELQGKTVFRIHDYGSDSLDAVTQLIKYDVVPDFRYFNRVKIRLPQENYEVQPGTSLTIPVVMENPTEQDVDFSTFPAGELSVDYCLFWYGKIRDCKPATEAFPVKHLKAGERVEFPVTIFTPPDKGSHWQFRLSIRCRDIRGRNSNFTHFKVK